MEAKPPSIDVLVRRVTDRAGAVALIRALGLPLATVPVPTAAWFAYGLTDAAEVRGLSVGQDERGFATLLIELRNGLGPGDVVRLARRLRGPLGLKLLLFADPQYRRIALVSFGLDGELRQLLIERSGPRATDIEALEEMVARDGEGAVALALRHARALDRSRMTRQFFRDLRAHRARIADAWSGLPAELSAERGQLALLLLSRLMFLYFLQRSGQLAGDPAYMAGLVRDWRRGGGAGTFFREKLVPLFFGALNTRPANRDASARTLGRLPFLNGGLFHRHALERRFPALDLPDEGLLDLFDGLLERYRFTCREAAEDVAEGVAELGVDPEMLGRVFEGLMVADRRGATGTFYTPAAVVDRLVGQSLEAYLVGQAGISSGAAAALVRRHSAQRLEPAERDRVARVLAGVRVLDPACGSGAFLLGALMRLSRARGALEVSEPADGTSVRLRGARRDIVGRSLYGVDVQEDAALLCALRLWLALADAPAADPSRWPPEPLVPPLPNLDKRIRQGDALLDPFDLVAHAGSANGPWRGAAVDAGVRAALNGLLPLSERYLSAEPEDRPAVQRALSGAEARLATAWLDALQRRMDVELRDLDAQAASRDLFGERGPGAQRAEGQAELVRERMTELARIRSALDDGGAVPFFSFGVHFAEAVQAGFDLILSNPPWVRAHRWPPAISRLVRTRYSVCCSGGWRAGAALAGAPAGAASQIDLSLLFLERAVKLLKPGGVLAMLLPAKALRSLYGGGGRRLLLEAADVVSIEDHSLDQRSIFRADAFVAGIVARKRRSESLTGGAPGPSQSGKPVRVIVVRRGVAPLDFTVPADELPLVPDDPSAPWLLVPPTVRAALRRMQAAGRPLGRSAGLSVRRGVMTGANDIMVVRDVEPKLAGLATIRAEGYYRARKAGQSAAAARRFSALIEASALRPLVRGSDVSAWTYLRRRHVIWLHDDTSGARIEAPGRVRAYLDRHTAGRPGSLFRLSADTLRPKVAWHDLGSNLGAVALPANVRLGTGDEGPLIPLNTVYFVPTTDEATALLLAAFLNSLPVRTFARSIAERAKDARFRFLAWTLGAVPLPEGWDRGGDAERLIRLSRAAHERGGTTAAEEAELNAIVTRSYALRREDIVALQAFDRWLRGPSAREGSG